MFSSKEYWDIQGCCYPHGEVANTSTYFFQIPVNNIYQDAHRITSKWTRNCFKIWLCFDATQTELFIFYPSDEIKFFLHSILMTKLLLYMQDLYITLCFFMERTSSISLHSWFLMRRANNYLYACIRGWTLQKTTFCMVHFYHYLLPLIDIFDDCTFHTHPSLRKYLVANSLYITIFLLYLSHLSIFIDFFSCILQSIYYFKTHFHTIFIDCMK